MTMEERQALVLDHLELAARAVDRAIRRYGLPELVREELSAAATLGLVDAASRFDPDRGATFATFAHYRISGEVIDHLRRTSASSEMVRESLDDEPFTSPGPEERALAAEDAKRLRQALRELPAQERELLRAHYVDGASLTDIAQRQGLSKSWVSRLHARALKALRDQERDWDMELDR